jgi:hypothetical protein
MTQKQETSTGSSEELGDRFKTSVMISPDTPVEVGDSSSGEDDLHWFLI